MTLFALALLVLAGAFHAGWNLIVKRVPERLPVLWGANLVASLVGLPILVWQPLGREGWLFATVSALLETTYFALLAWAYQDGDFSVVYPIARGTAPALIALGSVLLFGERLSGWGLLGLGLIVAGLMTIGRSPAALHGGSDRPLAAHRRTVLAAGAVALVIAVYSLVDARAVKTSPALPFIAAVYVLATTFLLPFVLRGRGRAGLWASLAGAGWRVPAVGLLSLAAYALVLSSYAFSPVGYASAVREVSIVFGAFAGWRYLGEGLGRWRVAGSLTIFAGVLAIALGG